MHEKEWSQDRGSVALNELQWAAAISKLIKYLVDAASCIHSSWFMHIKIALEVASSGRIFTNHWSVPCEKLNPFSRNNKK
jgi:vesicle coat complex subunit